MIEVAKMHHVIWSQSEIDLRPVEDSQQDVVGGVATHAPLQAPAVKPRSRWGDDKGEKEMSEVKAEHGTRRGEKAQPDPGAHRSPLLFSLLGAHRL